MDSMARKCLCSFIIVFILMSLQISSFFASSIPCNFRGLPFNDTQFKITTCSQCYTFLNFEKSIYLELPDSDGKTTVLINTETGDIERPSIDEPSAVRHICDSLEGKNDCKDLQECCEGAWKCCKSQQGWDIPKDRLTDDYCPQVWDGWSCWNYTQAGETAKQHCPSFIEYADTSAYVTKSCLRNGSWYVDNDTGLQWSDYNHCTPESYKSLLTLYKDAVIVGIALNSFGIFLLIPAIGIFIRYRPLRRQQRIKIHIHLFTSLLFSGIINLLWDIFVNYDRLQNDDGHSLVRGNQAGCKTLNILEQFGRACPFFWMLCEGLFLHRLLVKAFQPPKYLIGYYICGWGVPAFLSFIYALFKNFLADDNVCWIELAKGSKNGVEWIMSASTILCLCINLFLLLNIIRILIKQLAKSPREPSNFRRALKATGILIPLFGVHQFFLLYNVSSEQTGYFVFQMVLSIVNNSQGIVIPLLFCYFNGEVISLIKNSWRIRRDSVFKGDSRKSFTFQSNLRRLSNTSTDTQTGRLPRRDSSNGLLNLCVRNGGNDVIGGIGNIIQLSVIEEHSNGHIDNGDIGDIDNEEHYDYISSEYEGRENIYSDNIRNIEGDINKDIHNNNTSPENEGHKNIYSEIKENGNLVIDTTRSEDKYLQQNSHVDKTTSNISNGYVNAGFNEDIKT